MFSEHLDLDIRQGSEEDIIFSIMYRDAENENLTYEYKFMKNDGTVTAYFRGDPSGNYFSRFHFLPSRSFIVKLALSAMESEQKMAPSCY